MPLPKWPGPRVPALKVRRGVVRARGARIFPSWAEVQQKQEVNIGGRGRGRRE